jgi:hypothetical protein
VGRCQMEVGGGLLGNVRARGKPELHCRLAREKDRASGVRGRSQHRARTSGAMLSPITAARRGGVAGQATIKTTPTTLNVNCCASMSTNQRHSVHAWGVTETLTQWAGGR